MDELATIPDKKLIQYAWRASERARDAITKINSLEDAIETTENITIARDYVNQKARRLLGDTMEAFGLMFRWADVWLEGIRKCGNLIAEGQELGNIATQGDIGRGRDRRNDLLLLSDLGLDRMQSSRWKRVAQIHPEDYRVWIEDLHERDKQPTFGGLMSLWRKLFMIDEWEPLPEGKFAVIYADPPWEFQSKFDSEWTGSQAAEDHYSTEPTSKICTMPIEGQLTDETVLFLWVPNSLLMKDGRMVMEAWDFDYKTCMVWVKPKGPSMGWWVENKHEMLLIGAREKTPHPIFRPPSIFEASVNEHSRKPDIVYELIEQAYQGPYLELFARRTRDGWNAWGNEVNV